MIFNKAVVATMIMLAAAVSVDFDKVVSAAVQQRKVAKGSKKNPILIPPPEPTDAPTGAPTDAPTDEPTDEPLLNINDTLEANPIFSTLVTALEAADLYGDFFTTTLRNDVFTVFAPTDTAFDELPENVLGCLLLPQYVEDLIAILNYHVATGEYGPLVDGDIGGIEMLNEEFIEIDVDDEDDIVVVINGSSKVVPPFNLRASNGIVNAIDQVLIPVGT